MVDARARAAVAIVLWAASWGVQAASETSRAPVFRDDFGGVGLLQTPTARMAPGGELAFHYANVSPYQNFGFSLQPFDWLQVGFRYTSISNRDYKASGGDRDTLDKGVNAKLRLLREGRYAPEIAMGFRDFGGTGLFSSEYFVANKRWRRFDFSLGIAWGYLGARGDLPNPLGAISGRFKDRAGTAGGTQFNLTNLYTGRPTFFGGVQYHTPYEPLSLQLELDGNDYNSEPLDNDQSQRLPINVGARLQVNDNLSVTAAFERGDTAMFGATLRFNAARFAQPKNDPARRPPEPGRDHATQDWAGVAHALRANAGIDVARIDQSGRRLTVTGVNTRYRSFPAAELRANRILHNASGPAIQQFDYRWQANGFALREDRLPRAPLPKLPVIVGPDSPFSDADYRRGVRVTGARPRAGENANSQNLYRAGFDRFSWGFRPAINQNYGGPDGYLFQLLARADATFKTDRRGWLSAALGYTLYDNFDKFDYIADSALPRVRTYIGKYLDNTTLGVYNLQYTRTARLSRNVFGMAYAGLLEQMYGGAGAEVLYRPFNSRFAFGVDGAWVKQRDFDTQFGFRDYSTWTGHATAYIDTGFKGVLARLSVGRYLAKDYGGTINLSRRFDSGVVVGAFATFTDAGDKYGEGDFNKGFYISVPLDLFFTHSSRDRATIAWRPLTRDGGARLARRYQLYDLTYDRRLGDYWRDFRRLR